MKALVFVGTHQPLVYQNFDLPTLTDDHVVIDIKAAALNRRDFWITKGLYPGIISPTILGSDGAGVVDGREVLINPNVQWGDDPLVPSRAYTIMGLQTYGTFAQQVLVSADRVHDKPAHLSFEQAAALPLAGLTAYRALFTMGGVKAGDKVLVTGVGGGVALLIFQFAMAAGAEVVVTSSSAEKRERAMAMGAAAAADYKEEDWSKKLGKKTGQFDAIIDGAGGSNFQYLVRLCKPGGTVVSYGATAGLWKDLKPPHVFLHHITIKGSTMGNDQEFEAMLNLVTQHQIVPVVDRVFNLEEGNEALAYMESGQQFGKIVLKV